MLLLLVLRYVHFLTVKHFCCSRISHLISISAKWKMARKSARNDERRQQYQAGAASWPRGEMKRSGNRSVIEALA